MVASALQTRRSAAKRIENAVDDVIGLGAQIDPLPAWLISVASILLIGELDYLTGTRIWFGPVYIVVVLLSTWMLGARAGMLVGLACFAAGILANGASVYPYDRTEIVLNVGMRLLVIVISVMFIAAFRRSHNREWQSARIDHLTGAMTGRMLLEKASRRASTRGVLAYLDLDGFKAINDRFGHAAGDEVLRSFARQVSAQLREDDLFARLGGDEFLILVPLADTADAQTAIESLHRRLNASVHWEGHPVGCSIGAVVIPDGRRIDERDIADADRLMYLAKRDGSGLCFRNSSSRVELVTIGHGKKVRLPGAALRWNARPACPDAGRRVRNGS